MYYYEPDILTTERIRGNKFGFWELLKPMEIMAELILVKYPHQPAQHNASLFSGRGAGHMVAA